MALVKMTRAVPEVAGGKTACEIPEEAVEAAIRDGWSIAKDKEPAKEPKKEEKVEAVTSEPAKEEDKAPKTNAAKGKKLRDE